MNRVTVAALGVASSCVLSPASALANDSTFGGAGSDLVPLEETRVRMASEDILIEYDGRWQVTARYVFENLSTSDAPVQVGFPEYRCTDEYQDCLKAPFEGLHTEVDGKPVTHRQGKLRPDHEWNPYLGVVWLYDVTFPAKRRVEILHTYSVASGSNVDSNRSITYVTRTGDRWAGSIGHARFTFKLPASAHTVFVPEGIALKSIDLVDAEGPGARVEVVCEESNWNPTRDLTLVFYAESAFAFERLGDAALARGGLRKEDLCPPMFDRGNLTPAQRQMCVNDDYALRGYPFKRKALRDYYYGDPHPFRLEPTPWDSDQKWYVRGLRPFPGLTAWQKPVPENESGDPASPVAPNGVSDEAAPTPSPSASSTTEPKIAPEAPPPVHERPGGCGCRVAQGSSVWWGLPALFALAWRRQRRGEARR